MITKVKFAMATASVSHAAITITADGKITEVCRDPAVLFVQIFGEILAIFCKYYLLSSLISER